MTQTESSQDGPVFARGETSVAHGVYGLLLTIATLGELIHREVAAWTSTGWLLGAGLTLFAAHVYSDTLARTAATRQDPRLNQIIAIGREELAVTAGAFGSAGIMFVAAVTDIRAENALVTCVVVGVVAVAALSWYATAHHRWPVRAIMSATAAVFGLVIVTLENTF